MLYSNNRILFDHNNYIDTCYNLDKPWKYAEPKELDTDGLIWVHFCKMSRMSAAETDSYQGLRKEEDRRRELLNGHKVIPRAMKMF